MANFVPALTWDLKREMGRQPKFSTYAMERVAAGAHLSTPWLFQPAKRPVVDEKVEKPF